MSALVLLTCLVAPPPPPTPRPRPETLVEPTRTVLRALVAAARDNQRLPVRGSAGASAPYRRTGDELTEYYVQAMAAAAGRLPPEQAGGAFLLALGIGLDTSDLMRRNPVTGFLWARIEPAEARRTRLAVLGKPTLHARHDLAQHFAVSAALTVTSGPSGARTAGILKELLDSNGGSGFSFADLAADLSGISLAEQVLKQPDRLATLARRFRAADHCLSPRGLPEDLQRAAFEKRYGSVSDPRFQQALADLDRRVQALPWRTGDR
jgi:hypothetical protein